MNQEIGPNVNLLLFGSTGQLGSELSQILHNLGNVTALNRKDLDLSLCTEDQIESLFTQHSPVWVINASAYTAVDLAQSHADEAYQVNALFPEYLAKVAFHHDSKLIHFSTDFVFDGLGNRPYLETDDCQPLSVYGQTKLQGEKAISQHCPKHLIFRTGWLMSAHGENFLKTILRLAESKTELKIIQDQVGAPTPTAWLAQVTLKCIQELEVDPICLSMPQPSSPWGLYHASGSGEISWFTYAQSIVKMARSMGFELMLEPNNVFPIPNKEYPLPAKRPAYSVLDCSKLLKTFKLSQPDWQQSIQSVLKQIQLANQTK